MRVQISVSKALTEKQRQVLDAAVFGLPEVHKYPMPDRQHAINAKARAKQQLDAGNLTKADYDRIVNKANKILGTSD